MRQSVDCYESKRYFESTSIVSLKFAVLFGIDGSRSFIQFLQMFESSIKHMISGVDILIAGRYSRADELRIK